MKMRKKLAALLAVAMIASVMPMTAFAASTNRVDKTIKVGKDDVIAEATAPNLVIDLKDALTTGDAFYLELENAEWKEEDPFEWKNKAGSKVELKRVDGKTLEVKATRPIATSNDIISIPLIAKATGGEASVTIDPYGSVVSGGKYVFAVSDDSKAKVTVGDAKTIVDTGKMATITIEEPYAGAFASKFKDSDPDSAVKTITLELDNEKDFAFDSVADNNKSVAVKRGFGSGITVGIENKKLEIKFTKGSVTGKQRGIVEIKDVVIRADRKASEGEVTAYIKGDFVENETLVVAKYGDYAITLTTKEVKEFTAGNIETLEFKLSEVGKGAIVAQRSADFTLSKDIKIKKLTVNDKVLETAVDADDKNIFVITNFNNETTGSAVKINSDNEVKVKVEVEIPSKFSGDITVKAEGRALGEAKELKLAEVKAPVTVKVEPMRIEVGQKSNKGGKITITETEKGMIQRKTLVIQLPKDLQDDGVEFLNVGDLVLDTTGGIRVDEAKYNKDKQAITIEVTRQSSEAGSITISGFEVKSRRTIADGAYEIKVGGDAISKEVANLNDAKKDDGTTDDVTKYVNIDAISAVDFLLVGNVRSEVVFNIGSEMFMVDGKEMTMDAKAYIKDGRTMVPLRYLSYALGIDADSIKFNEGIVTIFAANGKVIQVANGSKSLVVNGMTIPMVTAAEIVEGRTYVPVTEIGGVFGVTGTWDATAQTATFK